MNDNFNSVCSRYNAISNSDERFIFVYDTAKEYLNTIKPTEVKDVDKYFYAETKKYATLKDIYERFIFSAQNYWCMPNVIQFEKHKKEIAPILDGFDYKKISTKDPKCLSELLRNKFNNGKENALWDRWCRSVVDSAKYICGFKDSAAFEQEIHKYACDINQSIKLANSIAKEIYGMGFALICDVLKELGFTDYSKPDIHLIEVFSSIGLSKKTEKATFKAVAKMADLCRSIDKDVTPYKVDKIFWLICSGKFYLETPLVKITGHKQEFIELFLEG